MDVQRLKKRDLQVWLDLDDEVQVLCRHISQSQFDDIKAGVTRIVYDPKLRDNRDEIDNQAFRSALGRAIVADWKGLVSGADPYPCTSENIDYLMEECTEFRLLVLGTPLSFSRMLAAEKAANEKNS